MKLDPNLAPNTKMNSKWIRDLNVRAETIRHIVEKTEVNLRDLGLSQEFLDMTPK